MPYGRTYEPPRNLYPSAIKLWHGCSSVCLTLAQVCLQGTCALQAAAWCVYRGTSLIRNRAPP